MENIISRCLTKAQAELEELFVTDKYGIFIREPYSDYKEYARNSLGIGSS